MKKILSLILVLLFCMTACFITTDISVAAEVVTVDTISEGETWRKSWSNTVEFTSLKLNVEETGFYNITINDYLQTGCFLIGIYDLTNDEPFGYIGQEKILANYTSKKMFLHKGNDYQLFCYYYDVSNEDIRLQADISITFNRDTDDLTVLPTTSLNSSNLMVQFTQNDNTTWLQYTPSDSGDYNLFFDDLHAYVSVYEASTGEKIAEMDTEYWYSYYDEWYVRDKLVFTLKANTKYYFEISSYNNTTTRLSVLKSAKNIKSIVAYQPLYTISAFDVIVSRYYFSYKATYTDNTTKIYSDLNEVGAAGYALPDVEYVGAYSEVNGDTYLTPGTQPVVSTYNGVSTTIYITVQSIYDYFSDSNVIGEKDNCVIEYDNESEKSYWWRIKVSGSGLYGIWRYNSDDFDTNFQYYSIEIVDENNNVVEFDKTKGGWVLLAGKKYLLNFKFQYKPQYSYNDIDFWLQKNEDIKNGWILINDTWYYTNSRGVMQTGWQYIGNSWYYFDASGAMKKGWQHIDGSWYYMNSSGAMQTGWQRIGNIWYYFNSNGAMQTGWQLIGGTWYYFYNSGAMASNTYVDGYYLTSNGAMSTAKNEWKKNSTGWWYSYADGSYAIGWALIDNTWYYFNSSGYMQTGWELIGGTWYYMNSSGAMQTGWQRIGNTWYYFYESGAMATNIYISGGYIDSSGAWTA